jgi:hypothetical protein
MRPMEAMRSNYVTTENEEEAILIKATQRDVSEERRKKYKRSFQMYLRRFSVESTASTTHNETDVINSQGMLGCNWNRFNIKHCYV